MADQQEPVVISSEEFYSWTEMNVTKHVVNQVVVIRDRLKEYLASGATLEKDNDLTTDRLVGRIEGITELFNLFQETKEDTKEQPDYDH